MSFVLKVGERTVRLPGQQGPPRPTDLLQLQNDFKEIFNSDAGVNVLEYLMRMCHFCDPTHVVEDPNGRHSAFQEGQRHVLDSMVAFLTRSPESLKAFVEAMEKQEQE